MFSLLIKLYNKKLLPVFMSSFDSIRHSPKSRMAPAFPELGFPIAFAKSRKQYGGFFQEFRLH